MHEKDISSVDLNLLKLFDALLREGSVTKAGLRLGLSQPAASRGLSRLRRLFNDRILVRTANGWELTPRALSLSAQVTKLLEDVRSIVAPCDFDPNTARGKFTIATADHLALILIPKLVNRLAQLSPNIDLVIPKQAGDNVELISEGSADLAVGSFSNLPARFYNKNLYEEDFVCVVRQGHPISNALLTPELFVAWPHLSVTITGHGKSYIDHALEQIGLKRRIAVKTPHFLSTPMIVAESDLILCLPRRLALRMANTVSLSILELPITLASLKFSVIWHERQHHNPAHIWLRNQIVGIAEEL